MKKIAMVLLCLVLGAASWGVAAQEGDGAILAAIQERGVLRCGVNTDLLGFSSQNEAGNWVGFDVEICRAVAAAILDAPDAVEYVPVAAADRQFVLEFGDVDMLSRNTTFTFSRDTEWNARFGPITFYDGQGLMVYRESGITNLQILAGGTICVETATTTEANIRDYLTRNELPYNVVTPEGDTIFESEPTTIPVTTIRTYISASEMLDGFFNGRCDAVTTDRSGLAARRAASPNPDEITILPLTISKEPLAPLSPDSDVAFANVIEWTVFGMITAERLGVTSENIDTVLVNPTTEMERVFGLNGASSGELLGIPNEFMVSVIRNVGNYGEIYERHLGPATPLGLDRGANQPSPSGLLYAPPFR
jgi:general L-amino acid transport system substrate-binding protein